jgi:hypothetical protein
MAAGQEVNGTPNARVAFMGGQSEKLRRRERHCIII